MGGFAWVTLATNDSYSLGALVLAHSLRNANTAHKLAVLITPGVSPPMKEQLSTVFDVVKMVDVLDSKDEAHLALMKRPELGVTFTKIHCWRLTEFEKCVFLDADTLVIKNCDELFDREELSAAPDVGWPDCFNTGVFVFKPSIDTFDKIIKFSLENGSFDGGDQGLLNQFFGDWAREDIKKHLPFVYNLTSVALYSYIPAFKQYGSDVRIVHFIGSEKPWLQQLDPQTKSVCTGPGTEHLAPMLKIWWDIFCDKVHPSMTSNLECDSGMRNDEIEACVSDNLIEPEPEIIQSFPPYVDKDDSRQINLPYQHFDVRSSTGELLNITYLEKREQEMKEREEDKENREDVEEGRTHNEDYRQLDVAERKEETANDVKVEENLPEHPVVEEEQSSHKDPPEEQKPEPEESPFNHETFFPDETCVQKYLQKNVMTYQPLDCPEEKQDIVNVPEQVHHLPRFLSIAEDDKRQSLNVYCREDPKPSQPPPEDVNRHHSENENRSLRKAESLDNWHLPVTSPEPAKTKWKSMSHLGSLPETKPLEKASFWKSHPSLNDPNRRYSMPKLKPILPKQSNSQTYAAEVRPKVTQYTEFQMSCDYSDAVPCDTLGFIERHMLEEVTQRIPNVGMERLKTLSYIFPLEAEGKTKAVVKSSRTDDIPDEVDCDLSSCERQRGNQPLHDVTKKRSNSCFLPVLKPIRPSKNEESKRSVKASSRSSKERGTKAKIESRKAREKAKSELNIKPSPNRSSVEDILKKLINFSKDYQVYFTEYQMVQNKGNERLLGTVFKNGYSVSAKDSPRIRYDKEFEELQDPPLSPTVNGYSVTKKEDTVEIQQTYPENEYADKPLPKIKSTFNGRTNGSNGTIASTDSNELEERNGVVRTVEIPQKLSADETEMVNGSDLEKFPNERQADGVSSKSETIEPTEVGTVKTNWMDVPVCQRNGTRSPGEPAMTYASVVKQGLKTLGTKPVTSKTVLPKEKITTKSRQSRTGRKKRKDPPMTSKQYVSIRAPPPEETETVEKPVNLFSLLPEDTPRDVTVKSAKRKPKPVRSKSFPRSPAGKANQDRRVIESLPMVDDSNVDKSGIAGAIAKLSIQSDGASGAPSEAASSALEDCVRRQNWEMGTMDYMGRDSFDNIWSKICETIDGKVSKDLNPDGASKTPSTDATTSQKHDVTPEKSQVQPQESPEKMAERSNVVPPGESDASPGTIGSEITAKASDIASKATEALEAFGKLFVSGPVSIKSEVTEDVQKTSEVAASTEKREQPQEEEAASTELKKSTEQDDEGKQKKGVINKILELVGVGKPETSTAVFYDTEQPEGEQPKEDKGKSIFYDTEAAPGDHADKENPKLSAAEAEGTSKVRTPSPSLSLKTSPGTEVVCPTPPSTPMTPQVVLKDDRMLTVVDEIKATPPVTDKKFDEVAKDSERSTIKSQVDSIIEEAKKLAEGQLQQSKEELKTSASSMSTALVPRLNDALEVFGKLFVSGPVTIKSEVPGEDQKALETPKTEEVPAKVSEEIVRPAIPMPEPPARMVEPTAPVTPEVVLATTETEPVLKSTEPPKSVPVATEKTEPAASTTPQTLAGTVAEAPKAEESPATKIAEPTAPKTPQTSEGTVAEAPKAEESPATKIAEPTAPKTPQSSEGTVAEAPKAEESPATKIAEPAASTTPQSSEGTVAEAPKAEESPATKIAEPTAPKTPQTSEGTVAEAPKAEESPAPKIGEASAPKTPQTSEGTVAEAPKAEESPATKIAEPTAPKTPQTSEGTVAEAPKAEESPATKIAEPTAPKTLQTSEGMVAESPKVEESPTANITELAAAAVEAVGALLTKATEPDASSGKSLTDTGAPETTQPTEPNTTQVADSSAPVAQPGTVQSAEPTASPVTPQKTEAAIPATPPSTPKTELSSTQTESPKPSEAEPSATQLTSENAITKDPKTESPSIIPSVSKANEALEAFGRHFVSGPVIIKSEEPEPVKSATPEKPESEPVAPAKDSAAAEGHSKTAEALEAFGKSFVSGPVTVKSVVPEAVQAAGEVVTDAVHRVFQSKPEDEPIYSNIEEVEEIKVTSEEDRRKEKPQSSKLTEQILKAIPPELRKPFSDAGAEVSPEIAQLLSSAEQQTTSILLDKPAKEEETPASGESESSGPSVPPVPPRRNRSKGRDAPQPPPKKKGKNGKD